MATLEENIAQAISDFDDIEAAIEEQGVDVPAGTDTSEYGNLIRSIPQGSGVADQTYNPESTNAQSGIAVKEAIDGIPIKYLENLDKENPLYFRDIESGYYVFHGYFRPYPNSSYFITMDTMYVSVARLDAGSHLMSISPLNFRVTCYEILVDETAEDGFTYTSTRLNLLDLDGLKDKVTTLEAQTGDIETALDNIIAIQNTLIGG